MSNLSAGVFYSPDRVPKNVDSGASGSIDNGMKPVPKRWVARVNWIEYPPAKSMPWPDVLVIEIQDHGISLQGFTKDMNFCGDTWHETVEEAHEQAAFEYGDLLGMWIEVPPDVDDAVEFALT